MEIVPAEKSLSMSMVTVPLRVDPRTREDLERWSKNERRKLGDFVRELVVFAASAYEHAGSLHSLRTGKPGKISELTHVEVYSALDTILEHGPPAVVERVVEFLTERAGKYGPR